MPLKSSLIPSERAAEKREAAVRRPLISEVGKVSKRLSWRPWDWLRPPPIG